RRVLLGACGLMAATGLGFAGLGGFAALLAVAFVGTLNPTAGGVSGFLPTEQALLAGGGDVRGRTARLARLSVGRAPGPAVGSLSAGLPEWLAARTGVALESALRGVFVGYAALAVVLVVLYLGLDPAAARPAAAAASAPLAKSRGVVLRLTALFSLDSFGG